jgi:hypothetical protein
MANPYSGRGKSTAESKFGHMGLPKGKAKHKDSADAEQVERIIGRSSGGRLDKFARGGRTKATSVNVVIQPPQQQQPQAMPMPMRPPMPAPSGPPPGGPPGGAPGGVPGAAPPSGLLGPVGAQPPPPQMPQMPPGMQLARGGKVGKYIGGEPSDSKLKQWAKYARKNSYHRKDGGRISGKYPLDSGGAESGVGRLEKAGKDPQ